MATAYQTQQIQAGKQPKQLEKGVNQQVNTFLNSVAFVINDTVDLVQINADASLAVNFGPLVTGVSIAMPPMDSSTGFAWTVGDSGSANRYISTSTTGQSGAGGIVSMNQYAGKGYAPFASTFSSYTTVSLQTYTVKLKVTVAASGTPTTANTIVADVVYNYDA